MSTRKIVETELNRVGTNLLLWSTRHGCTPAAVVRMLEGETGLVHPEVIWGLEELTGLAPRQFRPASPISDAFAEFNRTLSSLAKE